MKKHFMRLICVGIFISTFFSICDLFVCADYIEVQARRVVVPPPVPKPKPLFYDIRPTGVSIRALASDSHPAYGLIVSLTVENLGDTINANKVMIVQIKAKDESDARRTGGHQAFSVPLRTDFKKGESIPLVFLTTTTLSYEDLEICTALSIKLPNTNDFYLNHADLETEAARANNCEDLN
ncbi:MAG: hypothetical protein HQM16_09155 [Deltaproteobacteria bacterium]|nr:hypothetical protein [Deltaproteobacteria bacterium]